LYSRRRTLASAVICEGGTLLGRSFNRWILAEKTSMYSFSPWDLRPLRICEPRALRSTVSLLFTLAPTIVLRLSIVLRPSRSWESRSLLLFGGRARLKSALKSKFRSGLMSLVKSEERRSLLEAIGWSSDPLPGRA